MKAVPLSGILFIVVRGAVIVVGEAAGGGGREGAGKASGDGSLTNAGALRYLFDSALGNEREREWERANGLLLVPPNASASIDSVDGSLVRFLTKTSRPLGSRSIHARPASDSMDQETSMAETLERWQVCAAGDDGDGEVEGS